MNEQHVEEAKTALLEINILVSQLDPSIRAAAFEVLRPLYFAKRAHAKLGADSDEHGSDVDQLAPSDLATFISLYDHKKPADNVLLLAAWLYSSYGVYPISAKEIKELSDSCGLIVPERSDNTMRQAKHKGKSLFSQSGKGWQPTISGEIHFKEVYKVKKGNKTAPKD